MESSEKSIPNTNSLYVYIYNLTAMMQVHRIIIVVGVRVWVADSGRRGDGEGLEEVEERLGVGVRCRISVNLYLIL